MAIKLIKRSILLADVESSYGAGATLTGADGILIENLQHNPNAQTTLIERAGLTGALSMPRQQLVGRLAGLTFDVEMKGEGNAGNPPEVAALLRACGLLETIDPGVSVSYATTLQTALESAAVDLWDGGADRHEFFGIRGNMGMTLEAGSYGRYNFELTCHPNSPGTVARPTPSYDATSPEPLKQVDIDIGGFTSWEVYSATLSMNSTISAPPAITAPFQSGYSRVELTEWNPEIVINTAAQDIADGYDPFADMDNGVSRALVIGAIGAVAGNIIRIDAPTATVTNISTGDQEGRLTYEITYQLAESALGASDNLVITYS